MCPLNCSFGFTNQANLTIRPQVDKVSNDIIKAMKYDITACQFTSEIENALV